MLIYVFIGTTEDTFSTQSWDNKGDSYLDSDYQGGVWVTVDDDVMSEDDDSRTGESDEDEDEGDIYKT